MSLLQSLKMFFVLTCCSLIISMIFPMNFTNVYSTVTGACFQIALGITCSLPFGVDDKC